MLEAKALDVIVSMAKSVERIAKGQEEILAILKKDREEEEQPCFSDKSYEHF